MRRFSILCRVIETVFHYGENRSEKPLDVPSGIDLIDAPQTEFIQKFFCRPPAPAFAHFFALPDRSDQFALLQGLQCCQAGHTPYGIDLLRGSGCFRAMIARVSRACTDKGFVRYPSSRARIALACSGLVSSLHRPERFLNCNPRVDELSRFSSTSKLSTSKGFNRVRGFLSAIESPRDSLPPTDVAGELQRILARLVLAPSRFSWVVACSGSTCRRVGVRLPSRAQWHWRSGRLNAGLGSAQTAFSWPATAPQPAASCGFALLDLHGNGNRAPARSSWHSGLAPPAVMPAVDVVDRVLFLPPLADSATDETGRQPVAPAGRRVGLRSHGVRTGRG